MHAAIASGEKPRAINALICGRRFLSSKLVAPALNRRRSLAAVTSTIDTMMTRLTVMDERRLRVGAQPSSPREPDRVCAVPHRAIAPGGTRGCGSWVVINDRVMERRAG